MTYPLSSSIVRIRSVEMTSQTPLPSVLDARRFVNLCHLAFLPMNSLPSSPSWCVAFRALSPSSVASPDYASFERTGFSVPISPVSPRVLSPSSSPRRAFFFFPPLLPRPVSLVAWADGVLPPLISFFVTPRLCLFSNVQSPPPVPPGLRNGEECFVRPLSSPPSPFNHFPPSSFLLFLEL